MANIHTFTYPDQDKLRANGLSNGVCMVSFDDGKDRNTNKLVVYKLSGG